MSHYKYDINMEFMKGTYEVVIRWRRSGMLATERKQGFATPAEAEAAAERWIEQQEGEKDGSN